MKLIYLFLAILITSCGVKDSVQDGEAEGPLIFAVTGVADDPIPTQTKTWNWTCNSVTGGICEYRYVINNSSTHTFSAEPYAYGPLTDSQLTGNAIYYLHIQARDDLNLLETTNPLTVSVIIDNTAPTDPSSGAVAATYTANPTQSPNITWTASADTNGVDHYEMALGTSPGATDTLNWTDVGNVTAYQLTGLSLSDGVQYYPSIRAHDQATNVSGVHQNFGDFCSDTTAPIDPGNLNLVGQPYLTNSPQLTWDATTDACSGVQYYEVALGTTAGGSEVVTWTNVGTNLNHQFITIIPELDVGTNYYMSVRATDNAGITGNVISSIAWQIPASVNVTGVVNDPTPTKSKTWIWSCDNLPCDYRHVIDTTATYDFNGEAWGATTTDTQGTGDGTYYLHVQAKTQSNSDVSPTLHLSVIIDNTAPTDPTLPVLAQNFTTNATTAPNVTWTASTDANGVFDYEVGVGTTAGAVDTKALTSDGNDTSATPTGLTLIEGQNYYTTIRALDEAGNISNQLNTTAWCYDNTAPATIATVNNGIDGLVDRTPTHTWTAPAEACSGIDFYEMTIGTTPGGSEVVGWTNIGNVVSYQMTGLTLAQNTNYYTSVRSTDLATLVSGVQTSAAWQIDNPYITSVTPPANATYLNGQDLDFIVNWSENVDITNTPRIAITLTSGTVYADYLSGTGSSAITFRYTVGLSDEDADGITVISPLDLNTTGTINDSTSGNPALLAYTPPATASIVVDGSIPSITSITPPANATYGVGDDLDFIINWSENVDITNTPRIAITLTSGTVYADYLSGTGSPATTFRYTVAASDVDADGILLVSPVDLNTTGTIKDTSGNDATLTFTPPATGSILVDGIAPALLSITPPADTTFIVGQSLDFIATFDEAINISNTPRIQITLTSGTVYADYASGSGSNTITFSYLVAANDEDTDGIALVSPLDLNASGIIEDLAGNTSALTFSSPITTGIYVDGVVPTITSITPPNNNSYIIAEDLDFIVNFSENVNITNTPRIEITLNSGTVYADYLSGTGSNTITFRYTVASSHEDTDGIVLVSPLELNTTGIVADGNGNNASLTHTPPVTTGVLVDGVIPTVAITNSPTITATNESSYIISGTCSENGQVVDVNVGGVTGNPTCTGLAWSATLNVSGISDSASTTVADVSVTADHQDIALNSALQASATIIKDATAPTVSSNTITAQTYGSGDTVQVSVSYSENVNVTGNPRIQLNFETQASTPIYATYQSGTGTSTLLFEYTIQTGDEDVNNIASAGSIDLNSGTIEDVNLNSAALTLASSSYTGTLVDGIGPSITTNTITNTTYNIGENIDISVIFDENVDVTGNPRIQITMESQSSSPLYAVYQSGTGTSTLVFRYTVASGDGDVNGVTLNASIDLNSGTLQDSLNNNAALTLSTTSFPAVLVDSQSPVITSFIEPSNGTYDVAGELLFQVNFDEAVNISGTPRIVLDVGGNTRYATYQSGSGTSGLEFSYTIQAAENDLDGIQVTSTNIDLNSGTITAVSDSDAAGLSFGSYLDSLTSVIVNTASGITAPDQVTGVATAPTTSNTELNVTWSVPNDNGTTITNYIVQYREQGQSTWLAVSPAPTTNSATMIGLSAGITYEIRVAANNGLLGPYSTISTAEIFDVMSLDPIAWLSSTNITNGGSEPTNGQKVASWEDLTGAASAATEANPTNQPVYTTNVQNGLPAVRFDGLAIGLEGTFSRSNGTDLTFIVVGQFDTGSTDKCLFEFKGPGSERGFFIDRRYASNTFYSPASTKNTLTLWRIEDDGANASVTENSVTTLFSGATMFGTDFTGTGNYVLGDDTTGGNTMNGYIAEFLVFDRALTPTEISTLETYLKNKWGL